MKMKEKEKSEKMPEEEALEMLNELLRKAMKFDGVCSKGLKNAFKKIPRILKKSKRTERIRRKIGKAGNAIYSEKFEKKDLRPFIDKLALGLSELIAKYRKIMGLNSYLNIRKDAADFLTQESSWDKYMRGVICQLDLLFESYPHIFLKDLEEPPNDYHSIVIVLIVSLKMFNSIAPTLKK